MVRRECPSRWKPASKALSYLTTTTSLVFLVSRPRTAMLRSQSGQRSAFILHLVYFLPSDLPLCCVFPAFFAITITFASRIVAVRTCTCACRVVRIVRKEFFTAVFADFSLHAAELSFTLLQILFLVRTATDLRIP